MKGTRGQRRGTKSRDKTVLEPTCFVFTPPPNSRQGWGETWEALGPTSPGQADSDRRDLRLPASALDSP